MTNCNNNNCKIPKYIEEFENEEDDLKISSLKNEIFLNYIFDDYTKELIRQKALDVLIKEFN